MTTRIITLIHTSTMSILRLALLSSLVSGGSLLANDSVHTNHAAPARLVQIVREATRQFLDVNAATDYTPLFGCVSGPDHGAMGIHYINLGQFGDGEIDATRPEALIYEPM